MLRTISVAAIVAFPAFGRGLVRTLLTRIEELPYRAKPGGNRFGEKARRL
jgi:hypothetical protein